MFFFMNKLLFSTKVQQTKTTWSSLLCQSHSTGHTVIAHMSAEVLEQDSGVPSRDAFKHAAHAQVMESAV